VLRGALSGGEAEMERGPEEGTDPGDNLRLRLVLREGNQERVLVLDEFPASVGREESQTIRLSESTASRRHARIERQGRRLCLVDLESVNGTHLNGIRSRRALLDPGDEIRIGAALIRITGIEREKPLPAPPKPLQRSLKLPLLYRLAPAAILLLGAGALVYSIRGGPGDAPEPPAAAAGPGRGELRLLALKREAGMAEEVSAELIERAESLCAEYGAAPGDPSEDPFADFVITLRSRRELWGSSRRLALEEAVDDLLASQKYQEAFRAAGEETARLEKAGVLSAEAGLKLRERVGVEIGAASGRLLSEVVRLEELERDEECLRLSEKSAAMLEGTGESGRFKEKLGFLKARLLARSERKRAEEERRARKAEEARAAAGAVSFDGVEGLSDLLSAPIAAGALKGRVYRVRGLEGSPIELEGELKVTFAGPEGRHSLAWQEVPAGVQLQMAADILTGDPLLLAASFGYANRLEVEADRLLWKYLNESKDGRPERQKKLDDLLWNRKGLEGQPADGFTYTPEAGWENARERANRVAMGRARLLTASLPGSPTLESLERDFAQVAALLEDATLAPEDRSEVRRMAIEGLKALRSRLVSLITERATRKSFAAVREAKEELKRRRAEALRRIFDVKLYLPENHPDYPKGDVVNGQKAVDEAVGAVRELWEKPGGPSVLVDPVVRKAAPMVQAIDDSLFEKLYYRQDPKENRDLEEVLNNLDRKIDLRGYAASRAESVLHAYNRKVQAYNLSLDDPDLSEQEKAHVEFLNDYREMMGLRRLFIDLRLCRATRGHSQACSRAGRIWHVGPDGSPDSRARAQGFPAGVAENVAMGYGNPKDIWTRGWYRASDHHRNALGSGHTCMGYGYSGSAGTQNFSTLGAPFR
jgi:uncharacterized protein YkwD